MEEIRPRVESFWRDRELALYRFHAGLDSSPELGELYARYEDLTSREPLDELSRALDEERLASRRDGLLRLIQFIEEVFLEASVWELSRPALDPQARPDERDELLGERFARQAELRAKLGDTSGRARFERWFPELEVRAWERAADRLIETSESAYRDQLERCAARAGVDRGALALEQLEQLAARSDLDAGLRGASPLEAFRYLSDGWGLSSRTAIRVDAEPREGRQAASRCFAPRVPAELLISQGPGASIQAHRLAFEAAGRATALSYTSEELPIERRVLHDPALARGWSLFFAGFLAEPLWLRDLPLARRSEDLCEEERFRALVALRRASAVLRCELGLADLGPDASPSALASGYAQELSAALLVQVAENGLLLRAHPELRSLHELRARAFAAQLREYLRDSFGSAFWRERRCGELLKELWHTGASYTPESLAGELGFAPLELEHASSSALL